MDALICSSNGATLLFFASPRGVVLEAGKFSFDGREARVALWGGLDIERVNSACFVPVALGFLGVTQASSARAMSNVQAHRGFSLLSNGEPQ